MESARWEQIQELFHAAADLPATEQRGFLKSGCKGDAGLMADVLALFAEDARGSSPLDRGVAEAAHKVLAGASVPDLVAQQLGPYRIKRLLGEGGMGVVYLAERIDLGSLVAIKILSDAWLSPARLERFAGEQQMLAQLDHPAIARLYDAGALDDGTPYFVMEYVDGEPITDHCRACSATIEERLLLFRSLCEAVQFAHRHAIVHRDIKPSNVMVRRDGSVRLLDFGIAKHLDHLDAPATQTRTALRLMTPAYAAPEQFAGDRIGIYTDVYSLGVVLYELLSGRLPFDRSSRSPAEAMNVVADPDPDRPSIAAAASPDGMTASKSAWADLDVLVLTAMRRDPQRRYGSVEALMRDIDHYLRGQPLDARPDGFAYRLGKFVARNRRSVLLASATAMLVVGLVVFFTVRLATARDAALAEAARTQRVRDFMERMLTGGGEDVGPGKDLRVITLFDLAAKEARRLDQDPEVQADLFQTLGTLYQALGEYDTADSLLRSALERHRELHGEDSGVTVEAMVRLGSLRDEQAGYAEAESLFRRALEIGRRHLSAGDPRTTRAEAALGRVLINRGRYAEAIPPMEEVIRLQTAQHVPARDLSLSIGLLANAHFFLGHYAESDALNRRALALDRQNLGARHPDVASDLYNLGATQQASGNFQEAEKLVREALSISEAFFGRDHPEVGAGLTYLGRSLVGQGRLVEAGTVLGEALQIYERAHGKVHPRVASAVGELGHVAIKQGRLDDAEALYRRQGEIYRELFDEKHHLHAVVRGNLASVRLARKDYAAAEQLFRESVAIYRDALPAGHPSTAVSEVRLGGALVLQKRFAEAEAHVLAGYAVLVESTPDRKWLVSARQDLVAIYEALGQADKAARFRVELAVEETPPVSAPPPARRE
ncbi:MAG TPA: serine/threonine-protein kinase [Kofleriaceae bacterium]|nr:serine/threonine-protein kinase [Kofleriaceae bacterium]